MEGCWREQRCSGSRTPLTPADLEIPSGVLVEGAGVSVGKPCPKGRHRIEGTICWSLGAMVPIAKGPLWPYSLPERGKAPLASLMRKECPRTGRRTLLFLSPLQVHAAV